MRSVGATLERALSKIFDEPVKVSAAGRTDSGVHATGQVISFTTSRSFPFDRLRLALNSTLPQDVSIRDVAIVPKEFSARFSALERTYVYAIFNRSARSSLLARFAAHIYRPLDLEAMRAAALPLIGEHDFRSFCGTLPEGGVTIRNLYALDLERRGDMIRIAICASGFLHRMVRTIVGTLIACGTGETESAAIPQILAARARAAAGLTAPAQGLYLAGVRYDDGFNSYLEPPIFGRESG